MNSPDRPIEYRAKIADFEVLRGLVDTALASSGSVRMRINPADQVFYSDSFFERGYVARVEMVTEQDSAGKIVASVPFFIVSKGGER